MKADSDSKKSTSLSDSEEDLPIDLIDDAEMDSETALPLFIQKNLDPIIKPGDTHQVIPKTNSGAFPSIHSTKRVELVCRAWKNNGDRFWTYDLGKVRYIVKAFRTHAQPEHVPKIAYHVWTGMGGSDRFQKTPAAFDADDRLYGPDIGEKLINPRFGTVDTNKDLRTYDNICDRMLTPQRRSSTKGKGEFNIWYMVYMDETSFRLLTLRLDALNECTNVFYERDLAGEDDEEEAKKFWRPITRSMKREMTTHGRTNPSFKPSR